MSEVIKAKDFSELTQTGHLCAEAHTAQPSGATPDGGGERMPGACCRELVSSALFQGPGVKTESPSERMSKAPKEK